MKNTSSTYTITSHKYCWAFKRISMTAFYDWRSNIKWIFTIRIIILSILISC